MRDPHTTNSGVILTHRPRPTIPQTLAHLLTTTHDSGDEDYEELESDEEEYDEVEIPKSLQGEKMHCLIMGPSGCGKTTLAHAVAEAWHAMGLVSGKFTAIGKGDIASKWQGESLMRINELIESHDDGVLFIDEAYGIVRGKGDVSAAAGGGLTTVPRLTTARRRARAGHRPTATRYSHRSSRR